MGFSLRPVWLYLAACVAVVAIYVMAARPAQLGPDPNWCRKQYRAAKHSTDSARIDLLAEHTGKMPSMPCGTMRAAGLLADSSR